MSHSDITHYHLVVIKNKKPEINRALILFLVLFFITVIIMIMNIEEQKNPKHQEPLTNIYNPVRFTSIKADRHASFIRTSLAGTLTMMTWSGIDYSLNELTTFALILVLGIIVDDAIIIGESIFSEQQNSTDVLKSTEHGVKK